jgi:rhodanese-related sulfurtransferase
MRAIMRGDESMQTVTVEELDRRMKEQGDSLLLVDARGDEDFAREHLPHAKSVPESALAERVEGLAQKDSEIVVYCVDPDCGKSKKVGEQLETMGFRNVSRLPEGIEGWKQAGHHTVAS